MANPTPPPGFVLDEELPSGVSTVGADTSSQPINIDGRELPPPPAGFVMDKPVKDVKSIPSVGPVPLPDATAGMVGHGAKGVEAGANFGDIPSLVFKALSGIFGGAPEKIAERPGAFSKGGMVSAGASKPEQKQIPTPDPATEAGKKIGDELGFAAGLIPLEGIGEVAGVNKAIGAVGGAAKNSGKTAMMYLKGRTGKLTDPELGYYIEEAVNKAIRPTVVGKNSAGQSAKYYKRAQQAIDTIVMNKSELKIANEFGEIQPGRLPENLDEFGQAIDQMKSKIFSQYDGLAKEAGEQGLTLDVNFIADDIEKQVSNKAVRAIYPELETYGREFAGRLRSDAQFTPEDAQTAIELLNSTLKAYYRNPNPQAAAKVVVDAAIATKLRKALDELIEKGTGGGYQELKNQYAALREIQEDVIKRAVVDARKNSKGFFDLTDVFATGDIVEGLATLNPAKIARGGVMNMAKNSIKWINDPNRIVKDMFQAVEKHNVKKVPGIMDASYKVVPPPAPPLKQVGQAAAPKQLPAPKPRTWQENLANKNVKEVKETKALPHPTNLGDDFERVSEDEAKKRLKKYMFKFYDARKDKIVFPEGFKVEANPRVENLMKKMGFDWKTGRFKIKPLQSAFKKALERSKGVK